MFSGATWHPLAADVPIAEVSALKPLRILVPLAETVTSLRALDAVRHMAASADRCVVELLHVEELEGGGRPDDWRSRQTHAEIFLARQAEVVAGRTVDVSCQVAWGAPAEVILQHAQPSRFDFICLTTRAVPNNTDQPGSVAGRLFRDSLVPIIALPTKHVSEGAHAPRAFYRAPVRLAATFEAPGLRHPLPVTVRDLGANGAAFEAEDGEPVPVDGGLLVLSLPTRAEPLELATRTVSAQHLIGEAGAPVQVLHTTFPRATVGQQDAIVAFVNRLRVLQQQQRRVSVPVRIEVITGPRAFATFHGRTVVVRPDYVWLHMTRFDHIEGADVAMSVYSSDGRQKIELDGTVTAVKAVEDEFEAEVELAEAEPGRTNPGDKMMAFLHERCRDAAASTTSDAEAEALIPRPIRAQHAEQPVARIATATFSETVVPMRPAKKGAGVPFQKRAREAQEHGVERILKPHRKSAPLRSL